MRFPVSVRLRADHAFWKEKRDERARAIAAVRSIQHGSMNLASGTSSGPPTQSLSQQVTKTANNDHGRLKVVLEKGAVWNADLTPSEIVAVKKELGPSVEIDLNPPIRAVDVWPPGMGGSAVGTRRHALGLLNVPRLPEYGEGVNVVIVDYGLSDRLLAWERRDWAKATKGGWKRYQITSRERVEFYPGAERPAGSSMHAHMIARNVLSIAPRATIYDVPVLPETLLGPSHIAIAEAIYYRIFDDIRNGRFQSHRDGLSDGNRLADGPWILVNAWSAHDRRLFAQHVPKDVRNYWECRDHFFVKDMERLNNLDETRKKRIDVVFSAGNAGVPGGDPMATPAGSGPGRSIHGVNAHANVLTVGAVRVDGVPIGLSAQGPGRLWRDGDGFGTKSSDCFHNKPDICCPSHFREDDDGHLLNTGTSAACGVAAGMLAALRGIEWKALRDAGKGEEQLMPPAAMRCIMRSSALSPHADWNPRLGWGVPQFRAAQRLVNEHLALTA